MVTLCLYNYIHRFFRLGKFPNNIRNLSNCSDIEKYDFDMDGTTDWS